MKVKRYKNGNFTIQREKDEKLADDENLIIAIAWHVPDIDLFGESGCAGNFDMYQCFYSCYTDKKYMVLYSQQKDFEEGKVIRVYAEELDEDDREYLEVC